MRNPVVCVEYDSPRPSSRPRRQRQQRVIAGNSGPVTQILYYGFYHVLPTSLFFEYSQLLRVCSRIVLGDPVLLLNGRGRRRDAHGGLADRVDGDILSPVQDVTSVVPARNP